jgi:hypothetical protein
MGSMSKRFSDVPPERQAGMIIGVLLQAALAVWAFVDLARRPAAQIRGPKQVWIPVILVNWIGPAVYFIFARRR